MKIDKEIVFLKEISVLDELWECKNAKSCESKKVQTESKSIKTYRLLGNIARKSIVEISKNS